MIYLQYQSTHTPLSALSALPATVKNAAHNSPPQPCPRPLWGWCRGKVSTKGWFGNLGEQAGVQIEGYVDEDEIWSRKTGKRKQRPWSKKQRNVDKAGGIGRQYQRVWERRERIGRINIQTEGGGGGDFHVFQHYSDQTISLRRSHCSHLFLAAKCPTISSNCDIWFVPGQLQQRWRRWRAWSGLWRLHLHHPWLIYGVLLCRWLNGTRLWHPASFLVQERRLPSWKSLWFLTTNDDANDLIGVNGPRIMVGEILNICMKAQMWNFLRFSTWVQETLLTSEPRLATPCKGSLSTLSWLDSTTSSRW